MACRIIESQQGGFPDDDQAPAATLISTQTLAEVAAWFANSTVDEMRRRFRTNLEIDAGEAFWEDRLYTAAGSPIRLRIGDVAFLATNPCQRCVVPTRHPETGTVDTAFASVFRKHRAEKLPRWASRSRFDHFYRLAVNMRISPDNTGTTVRVGDEVVLDE
jgi:hypothetical protein